MKPGRPLSTIVSEENQRPPGRLKEEGCSGSSSIAER